jgi:hypothetical protein
VVTRLWKCGTLSRVNPTVIARGDQLRAAAKELRDQVSPGLKAAREKIRDDATEAGFGPTAAPAAQQFLTAWRAELSAVVDAVEQLAVSLDQAAIGYDQADQTASNNLHNLR